MMPMSLSWQSCVEPTREYDDVIKWEHFPRYWPFGWGIHRWLVNSAHKGQWRGALRFSLIWAWINGGDKQWWGWWFETSSRPLWRHCNEMFNLTPIALNFSLENIDDVVMSTNPKNWNSAVFEFLPRWTQKWFKIHICCISNTMIADDLATQAARTYELKKLW